MAEPRCAVVSLSAGIPFTMPNVQESSVDGPVIRSHISRKWLVRMILIGVGLFAFGMWGLFDALVAYPKRGAGAASFAEFNYLDSLETGQSGSVDDPVSELARLKAAAEHSSKAEWLEQLSYIGRLNAAQTLLPRTDPETGVLIPDAATRREELSKRWTRSDGKEKKAPKRLSALDIPTQWLITALGAGLGLWMFALVAIVRRKTYTWEPASLRLGLPEGGSVIPDDVAEFDKRKWHKFFIHLHIKPSHPTLGGKEIPIDLMRYEPVENWILEMERIAFPPPPEAPVAAPSEDAPALVSDAGSEKRPASSEKRPD